ncbi:MAG: ABC transporter [Azospirillum sp.]|nr:ABC transporter [Azospirillum sp.]
MTRKKISLLGLGLAVILFVAVNVLADNSLRHARLDLTADRLYTLSPGTAHILEAIKEPITLRLFFSSKLAAEAPAFRVYQARVRELLEEYVNRAHGKITLQEIDPEPFSDAEDRAVQAGIQGVPLDQSSGAQVYFGLLGTNSTDRREVIPFFQQEREPFLEYDLTKLVYNLTDAKKAVVGVLGDMPLEFGPGGMMAAMRGQSQPYVVLDQMRQLFDVRMLKPDLTKIDDDIAVLVLARPKALPAPAQYAVDQFVLRGGRAMVFVDPWAESAANQPTPGGMPDVSGSQAAVLPELLKAWGVEMADNKFVADPRLALRVASGDGARRRATPYPAWLAVPADHLDGQDVVTANLNLLNIASAGSLKALPDSGLGFEPLVWSSDQAELADVDKIRFRPDPEGLSASLAGPGQRYVLAARVTGTVKTAFPDGPPSVTVKPEAKAGEDATKPPESKPPETKPSADPAAQLKQSKAPVNLIVVADSDLLEDRYWVQTQDFFGQRLQVPIASNADFLTNGIDNLTGSNDLIGLRGRAGSARPFTVVDELRQTAGRQFQAREQALRKQLAETEKQIADLKGKSKAGASALLSPEEQTAIDRFKAEILRTRKELRDVQHNLNRDIERLSAVVKAINIGLIPLAIAVAALVAAGIRARRRRAALVHD